MATSLLSTDEQNFIHFGIATVEEIPRILRILLESEIQPHDLPKAVRNCSTIKLFQDQRNLVCPKSANDPDYECFDVTLLYTLIRNLCPAFTPTKGWKATPSASEVLVGDDIARLRDLRNKSFAHVKNAFISDSEFKNLWSSLEDICKRMETQTKTFSKPYHNGLDKILRKELGTESIEFYQAMVASENQCIRRELNELSKNVGALVIEQRKKSSTLKICGPSIVEYGTDVEFYIEFDGESNNNIHSVSWIRREGAVSHEIDTKNEKYEGSLNEKLIIRNVSFEDNGKYQAIMLELNQTHIHSNQIELMVSGRKKWIKYDENKSMDIDIRTFKYQGSTLHVQTSMLIINNADFRDQCDYCFAVSNAVGEVRSDPFVLRVLGCPPEISLKEGTDTEISTTFSARVISVPSVTSLSWENIITTDHGTQCIPIDIRDSMYQDSSNLCPFPKLVVKKSKAVDLHKIKLVAENFIGKADVIVDVQEYIRCRQEDNLKRQELPGYRKVDSSKIKELDTLLDFFSFLLSENYFSSTDVVFMQLLLRRIKREDLEKMCIKYATEDSKALCYFAESETPDCKDCLRLDGIRQTSSFNLVFEMKNEYVQKLLNVNPGKFEVLGRYSVDKIIVGGQTIHIDSSEM
ncbi:uncharacterized protein LOC134270084, partial [Saccostrea cucullata]|uniref:uncharacterized protein LOC134270084 n=1 Tax=Saccostrea cuccullata TaxID=36930 RepID=UPI002ED47A29